MNKMLKYIEEEKLLKKMPMFLLGVFIIAFNYNLYIIPNGFVLGGASGIAMIVNKMFGMSQVNVISFLNVVLFIASMIFLGKKESKRAIVGSIVYPLLISLTEPVAKAFAPYLMFDNFLITVLICAAVEGLGYGLIYKAEFNTGGGDILIKMVHKYLHMSDGNASLLCNSIILSCGIFTLGVDLIVYSVIMLVIISMIEDRILIGISDSKMFFIYSDKYKAIQKYIMEELSTGVTVFNTEGGFLSKKREMLMVVVSTKDYYRVKEKVLEIDNDAFFVVSDCYEVNGGIRRKNLPFI